MQIIYDQLYIIDLDSYLVMKKYIVINLTLIFNWFNIDNTNLIRYINTFNNS